MTAMRPRVTVRLVVDAAAPDPAAIADAARVLVAGGLVVFPTETVYGLGAHALDAIAVAGIFDAKERPHTDPLIVHLASTADLPRVAASVPADAAALAAAFWPGPLTLILPRHIDVPAIVTAGLPNVAVRVPAHPVAQALLAAAGVPVAAPSANRFSRPSPTTAAHVLADLDARVDVVLDGGPTDYRRRVDDRGLHRVATGGSPRRRCADRGAGRDRAGNGRGGSGRRCRHRAGGAGPVTAPLRAGRTPDRLRRRPRRQRGAGGARGAPAHGERYTRRRARAR